MGNISISAPLVSNALFDYITKDDSCATAVEFICGDDTGAPVRHVVIEITAESGKAVRIVIPNDLSAAIVEVDGERI